MLDPPTEMTLETKLPKVGTTIFTVMSQLAIEHGAEQGLAEGIFLGLALRAGLQRRPVHRAESLVDGVDPTALGAHQHARVSVDAGR